MRSASPFVVLLLLGCASPGPIGKGARPNILFAIADDWGWPHAGAYGDPVVGTATFDRLAREGVLFTHAFVPVPSCTPSRASILTGQWFARLGQGASLFGPLPAVHPVYPDLLESSGYFVGYARKGWGPGKLAGRPRNPAGPKFKDFGEFLSRRPKGKPFCFWFGGYDPHRPYRKGSGAAAGMALGKIRLPACFPDSPEIRGDVADYYWEVRRFDREVGAMLDLLEKAGELDRTVVVMTGDHGMPFPRCKANLYDSGTRVPLAVRWPGTIRPGRTVDDFVSLADLAPTFLEMAEVNVPEAMTGRSLLPQLAAPGSGTIEARRDHVLTGKERHEPCQEAPDAGGTPMRSIRTKDYLYIRNYRPDRWPAGTPNYRKATLKDCWYGDIDNGPTKSTMIDHRDRDETHRRLFDLAFGKRPAEELYDLRSDPHQLRNVAGEPGYGRIKATLAGRLDAGLRERRDPRAVGGGDRFDRYPYTGGWTRWPGRQ